MHSNSNAIATPLTIQDTVKPEHYPGLCDFWIIGKNTLVYSYEECDFMLDINHFINTLCGGELKATFAIDLYLYGDPNKWTRDFISAKTEQQIFVLNQDVNVEYIENVDRYLKAVYMNKNIGIKIVYNEHIGYFDNDSINYSPTDIYVEGGNVFNCVNALGEYYFITSENSLNPLTEIQIDKQKLSKIIDEYLTVGGKSIDKFYSFSVDEETDEYIEQCIEQRQRNKQILKSQLIKDTKLIILPNTWAAHLDLEMVVLPNGVALIQSFYEAFLLMEKHKDEISKKWDYDELVNNMEKLAASLQPYFDYAKKKLIKHNFIVKEVCCFISSELKMKGLVATGCNGLPIITKDGKMIYTLPPNEKWYTEYFTKILEECGMIVHPIQSKQSLNLLRKYNGFFRCQTNTISNDAFKSVNEKLASKI